MACQHCPAQRFGGVLGIPWHRTLPWSAEWRGDFVAGRACAIADDRGITASVVFREHPGGRSRRNGDGLGLEPHVSTVAVARDNETCEVGCANDAACQPRCN